MATPPEPVVHPDSLVHVQLSPDRRTAGPGTPARFALFVDNHDRRARAVKLQFGGAMSRYSRPRLHTLDVMSGEQREVTVEVFPQTTAPEGGHEYELTVTATDLTDGAFLDRSAARVAVDRRADLKSRSVGPQRTVDSDPLRLRFVAYNSGNVELRVEVYSIDPYHWVRNTGRQRARAPLCVFVEVDQLPRTILPVRVAVLGAAVLVALLVLTGFMAYLTGR